MFASFGGITAQVKGDYLAMPVPRRALSLMEGRKVSRGRSLGRGGVVDAG